MTIILDQYIEITERNTSTVNLMWKVYHLVALVLIIVSGFVTAFAFGTTYAGFDNNCILFPTIVFKDGVEHPVFYLPEENTTVPNRRVIDRKKTEWSSNHLCHFCQFLPLMTSIFGFVWAVFILMCARGGLGYSTDLLSRPWRIIYPTIIVSVIFSVVTFISTTRLDMGLRKFCAEFEKELGTKSCNKRIDEYTLTYFKQQQEVYKYISVSIGSAYTLVAAWVILLGSAVLRVLFAVDFRLSLVTIQTDEQQIPRRIIRHGDTKPELPPPAITEESERGSENDNEMRQSFIEQPNSPQRSMRQNMGTLARLLYY